MPHPRAPSYLNSRLLGYVTIGYIEPSSHYLGNWPPRVEQKVYRAVEDFLLPQEAILFVAFERAALRNKTAMIAF